MLVIERLKKIESSPRAFRIFTTVLMVVITMIWGYAWVLMKQILEDMGPFTFSVFRFWTGALTLFLLLLLLGRLFKGNVPYKALFVLGSLQTTFPFALVMYAMNFVEAGKTSVLLYTMPIWSTLLASPFLHEKLNRNKVIGMVTGALGLLIIVGADALRQQSWTMLVGEGLILLGALSWSAANIYYRLKFSGQDKLLVSAYQMLFGALGLTVMAVLFERDQSVNLNGEAWFVILFTGVLASALCFSVWYYILDRLDTFSATFSTLLVPIFGVLFSWLILDEPLPIGLIFGGTLILFGIGFSQWKGSVKKPLNLKPLRESGVNIKPPGST
jgi:drug/metabolite transporter (DMT)-like permease